MSNYITYNPYITSTKKGGVSAVFLSKKPQNFHISNTSQATVKEYVYYGFGVILFYSKIYDSLTSKTFYKFGRNEFNVWRQKRFYRLFI